MRPLGVIGGTGLDRFEDLSDVRAETLVTPYGEASLQFGELVGTPVVFVPRHGHAHSLAPHEINYRANIWALKQSVESVVAVAAVGGIGEDAPPRSIVVPDQIVDYTWGRDHTYSEPGKVLHIDFTHPYDAVIRDHLLAAAAGEGIRVMDGGVYGATQGPRLETAAEIDRMDRDGCTIVGMTGMPEASLARELELPYACCALVVNEAAGRGPEVITMEDILGHLQAGMGNVRQLLRQLALNLGS